MCAFVCVCNRTPYKTKLNTQGLERTADDGTTGMTGQGRLPISMNVPKLSVDCLVDGPGSGAEAVWVGLVRRLLGSSNKSIVKV